MPETETLNLPLLPLSTGVVLPQMVVTLALETAEARDAADGAIAGDRRVLLVPRVGSEYTRVGTVARIENEGELPGGQRALVLRGLSRAIIGRTVPSDRLGLWVDAAAEYRRKLSELTAQGALADDVRVAIEREIDRFERTSEQSPEHGWIRTWIDTVLEIPWGTRSQETLDVSAARDILDADHTGLEDVKDRIVEYLAVRKLRAERGMSDSDDTNAAKRRRGAGAILALVGPPGVGKT